MRRLTYRPRRNPWPALGGVLAVAAAVYLMAAAATANGPWTLPVVGTPCALDLRAVKAEWERRGAAWSAQQAADSEDSPTGWRWTTRDDDARRILRAAADDVEAARRKQARGESLGSLPERLEGHAREWQALVAGK